MTEMNPIDPSPKPRSGWSVALEVVGWLIVFLSGTCTGYALLALHISVEVLMLILIFGALPMAFGGLLVVSFRRSK